MRDCADMDKDKDEAGLCGQEEGKEEEEFVSRRARAAVVRSRRRREGRSRGTMWVAAETRKAVHRDYAESVAAVAEAEKAAAAVGIYPRGSYAEAMRIGEAVSAAEARSRAECREERAARGVRPEIEAEIAGALSKIGLTDGTPLERLYAETGEAYGRLVRLSSYRAFNPEYRQLGTGLRAVLWLEFHVLRIYIRLCAERAVRWADRRVSGDER